MGGDFHSEVNALMAQVKYVEPGTESCLPGHVYDATHKRLLGKHAQTKIFLDLIGLWAQVSAAGFDKLAAQLHALALIGLSTSEADKAIEANRALSGAAKAIKPQRTATRAQGLEAPTGGAGFRKGR